MEHECARMSTLPSRLQFPERTPTRSQCRSRAIWPSRVQMQFTMVCWQPGRNALAENWRTSSSTLLVLCSRPSSGPHTTADLSSARTLGPSRATSRCLFDWPRRLCSNTQWSPSRSQRWQHPLA
eukprot:scaffold100291_cov61-Phaeocystis_antarctica.AAC.3